jgi:hypothetical protein
LRVRSAGGFTEAGWAHPPAILTVRVRSARAGKSTSSIEAVATPLKVADQL